MTKSHISFKCWAMFSFFFLILAIPISADVIFLIDGKILIGSIIGPDDEGVAYSIFGERVVLGVDRILKTEKSIQSIADMPVNVLLKDGTTLHGRVVDFDEEIGFFVDIGFGILSVPIAAVSEIVDPEIRKRYTGAAYQIRFGGGMYLPLGSDYYSQDWLVSAGGLFPLPFVRGLFGGLSASLSGVEYSLAADTADDWFLTLAPVVEYHFLGWRMREDFLRVFTPFIGVQAGATYISVRDPAAEPVNQGSLTGSTEVFTGIDFGLPAGFVLRLDLFGSMILQSGTPFLTAGARLHACYEL